MQKEWIGSQVNALVFLILVVETFSFLLMFWYAYTRVTWINKLRNWGTNGSMAIIPKYNCMYI